MKIVIFSGQQPHHQHLCGYIAQRHNVVGVFHPETPAPRSGQLRKKLKPILRLYGWLYALLRIGTKLPTAVSGWNLHAENNRAEGEHFPQAGQDYSRIDSQKIFSNIDVNSQAGIELVQTLAPDVVINLGGIIYKEEVIQSCELFLNYHSGISPIYNGTNTVNFAFANGHPHLCGGTLMTMSPVIDGGVMLGHYFPAISEGETPASLNMKTFAGAAIMYDRFLSSLKNGKAFAGAPQHRPVFYVRGSNWTLYQTLMTRYHLKKETSKQHRREETIVEYWRQSDDSKAENLLSRTLTDLLWGKA